MQRWHGPGYGFDRVIRPRDSDWSGIGLGPDWTTGTKPVLSLPPMSTDRQVLSSRLDQSHYLEQLMTWATKDNRGVLELDREKNHVGLAQPIANWAKRMESHPEDGGERYRQLLGNGGVLAHTRGVREPQGHIAPRAPETTRPPCFLPFPNLAFFVVVTSTCSAK